MGKKDRMSDDDSTRMFQEKPDWKGKIKSALQKTKGEATDFLQRVRGKNPNAFHDTELSPLSEDSNSPMVADPSYGGQPHSPRANDRTLNALVRMAWHDKLKPHLPFSKGASRSTGGGGEGGGGYTPGSESGSRWNAHSLNTLALFASLLLIAWTGADLAAFFVEKYIPEPPVSRLSGGGFDGATGKSFADYQIIISRNLFSSLGRIPGDEVPGAVEQDNEPVKTSLPLSLIGTVILKNELRSVATLDDKDINQVYPVRVEDEVPGKLKILSIQPFKVIFRNLMNGRKEFVDMPEDGNGPRITVGSLSSRKAPTGDAGVEQVAPGTFNIARSELDKNLANINEILTQARAIPHFENGQPAGFKLVQIVPGSIYEKLGLKNGDVLKGVNGEPVDAAKALEMMGSLKTATQLELSVQRNGKTSNMSYNFR